ncbi:MAG: M23 family metallopeptidase [Rikenellaceae bacterium]
MGKENYELITKIRSLQDRTSVIQSQIDVIGQRDISIYRAMFGVDSVEVPKVGLYDRDIESYNQNRYASLINQTWNGVDYLSQSIFSQIYALDTLQYLSINKEKMIESLPAIWPIERKALTSRIGAFGTRIHPIFGYRHTHTGVDLPAKRGTPIYATAAGKVLEAKWNTGYGKSILIDHGYGYETRYAHLTDWLVEKGDEVVRGMEIGTVGNTGNSTGPHLHYEVIYRGRVVNPLTFLGKEVKDEDFYNIINSAKETTYESEVISNDN